MRTSATPLLLLLLACFLWPAEAQSSGGRRQSVWEDPIKFNTKAKDACTMTITGQGEHTKLRVSCRNAKYSYRCEYLGKPHTCRAYNKNPRHYFVQTMWQLRKLQNACQGPKSFKPIMCKTATDAARMDFLSVSFSGSWLEAAGTGRTTARPARPQVRAKASAPSPSRRFSSKPFKAPPKGTKGKGLQETTQPTAAATESVPKRIARRFCWRSLEGVCTFVIRLFRS